MHMHMHMAAAARKVEVCGCIGCEVERLRMRLSSARVECGRCGDRACGAVQPEQQTAGTGPAVRHCVLRRAYGRWMYS